MITYTGKRFWPRDPHPDDVDFRDIAHALSMICRYGGHVRRFYSVAEHSTLLARYFLDRGEAGQARCAIVHDMAEAYVGDLIRPLKRNAADFEVTESMVYLAIVQALPPPLWDARDAQAVKAADSAIIANEARELFLPETRAAADWTLAVEPLDGVLPVGWPPHVAETAFARMVSLLFPELAA